MKYSDTGDTEPFGRHRFLLGGGKGTNRALVRALTASGVGDDGYVVKRPGVVYEERPDVGLFAGNPPDALSLATDTCLRYDPKKKKRRGLLPAAPLR